MNSLFDSLQIGSMTLKNRTFMAPMSLGYGNETGVVSPQQQAYWLERAKGGVGCIITDATSVDPNTPYLGNTLCFRNAESIHEYKKFTDQIHAYGAKIIPQITHPGPESISSFFGVTPISSSGYLNSMHQKTREVTLEEIPEIIQMYAHASYQAKCAGFDGIELHCAHGYMLLGSFLSPLKNKRKDAYGGSLMNRARLLFEVVEAIKKECGKDFPIILRISGSEKIEGGNTVEDTLQLIPELEKKGVDAFEISGGSQYEMPNKIMPSHGEKQATNLVEALKIKEVSSVPVLLVGKINDAKLAKDLVNQVDGIVLGRALLADPYFVEKIKEGKEKEIAPCTGCLTGCVGQQSKRLCGTCVINPFCGHETEMKIEPSSSHKRVMVIGAGVAGLSAARICALRGLHVEVFEKSSILGGQIHLASKIESKKEMHKWIDYLAKECERLHVKVHLKSEVHPNDIHGFDVVLVCNGSIPNKPMDQENSYTAHDVLADKVSPCGKVLVVGGGMVGVEASEYICEKEKNVEITILEMKNQIDEGEAPANYVNTMKNLKTLPIRVLTETKLVSTKDGVLVEKNGKQENIGLFDFIIFATGSKPDSSLYEKIKETGIETYTFGDANHVANALEAIRDGVKIALTL